MLDGELLVMKDGEAAPSNDLQQRLNRKRVGPKFLADHPAHIRLYDMLFLDGSDLRDRPLHERRAHLENWFASTRPERFDLSPVLDFCGLGHPDRDLRQCPRRGD